MECIGWCGLSHLFTPCIRNDARRITMSANDTAGNPFQTSSLSIADLKRAVAQVSARSIPIPAN